MTWRQHRTALLGIAAVLAAGSVLLTINGLMMRSDWHQIRSHCVAIHKPQCSTYTQAAAFPGFQQMLQTQYAKWITDLPAAFLLLPMLCGVFLGAPLLTREYWVSWSALCSSAPCRRWP